MAHKDSTVALGELETHVRSSIPAAPSLTDLGRLEVRVESAATRLLALVSALPEYRYSQAELLHLLGYDGNATAQTIFERSSVETRYLVLDEAGFDRTRDPHFQLQVAREGSFALAKAAIQKALAASGVGPEAIGCLIVNTSSALQMPGLCSLLVNDLRLPQTITKYDLVGTGCVGAVPLFSIADDYLKAHPDKMVLAVGVDIGSKVLQKAAPDNKEAIVANSLFSDGAVGLVFGQATHSAAQRSAAAAALPALVDTHTMQAYDWLDSAHLSVAENGARTPHLHRHLPERSATLLAPALRELLDRHGLDVPQIAHWAFHPGGRAILDRLQADLDLSDAQMGPSRAALRDYGNASSPTCLLALQQLLAQEQPKSGDLGLIVAIGPGLSVGLVLVRWN